MNNTEMGEYIVGAYLKIIKECDFIDYNIREPGGGLAGLDELDVIGLDFHRQVAYLCEVTTHIRGLLYGSGNEETVKRIKQKYEKQQKYAKNHLSFFPAKHYVLVACGSAGLHYRGITGTTRIRGNYKRPIHCLH